MSDLTVEEFVNVVQRSNLLKREALLEALADCKSDAGLPTDPQRVAEHLIRKGLLTEWQSQNLLKGKSRGFFLGNYRLEGHLGTGGMSSVFSARHGLVDRTVAIKVLPSSKEDDPQFLDRFEREALATSRLSHPNVVRVFDIDTENKTHYIVMEYVSGRNLKDIVESDGPLPLEQAADYVAQIAAGLHHAHERGLVHRDVKPANLVVNNAGTIKVLDLGLARLDDEKGGSLTTVNSNAMMGTADYLAPEQARDAHSVDHRADIYALGCTFYFLLTGHPPFTEGSIAERILKHQTVRPTDVRAERSDCPHALADVCMTMLAKQPNERYESCAIIAQRLVRWLMAKGHPIALTSAEYAGSLVSVPILPVETADEPVVAEALSVDEVDSIMEKRKSRVVQPKAPLWLWLFLALAVAVCIVLLIFVVMQQS